MSLRVSNVAFKDAPKLNNNTTPTQNLPVPVMHPKEEEVKKESFIKENLSLINSGLVLVSLGVGAVAVAKGKDSQIVKDTTAKISSLTAKLEELGSNIIGSTKKLGEQERTLGIIDKQVRDTGDSIRKVTDDVQKLTSQYNDKVEFYDRHFTSIDETLGGIPRAQADGNGILERDVAYKDGIKLTRNLSNDGTPIELPQRVITWLEEAANTFINNGKNHAKVKPLTKDSTIWSITAESIPEKEGGLGEVPVQIAKNLVTKDFDINNYIVRPMVQWPRKSQLLERAGQQTVYRYNITTDKVFEMPIDKVAEFKMNAMRNGRYETQNVEVYIGVDPEFHHKRLMFKNDDYFTANGIYKASYKVSEPERFAFFDKAVYEFMKLKADPNSATHLKICDVDKFKDIKIPDAMILNDWQAGGLAGLMRLKAPCEAGMGELSTDTAKKFQDMNLVNIIHNLDYQGYGGAHSEDILNTLFDKYTYDIYKHAKTPFGFSGIDKILTINGNSNLANMGICLSNMVKPVSPTYARELAAESARSRALQHVCEVRIDQGTMRGASNGWDRELNEISPKQEGKFFNSINSDKVAIIKDKLESIGGLSDVIKEKLLAITRSKESDASHLTGMLEDAANLKSPLINSVIEEIKRSPLMELRRMIPYTHNDSLDTIMLNRRHNKRMFIEHLNSMVEYQKTRGKILFNIGLPEKIDLTQIKPEELDDIIVYDMGVRFVTQKGVDVACDAIKKVMTQWKTNYPGKPLPLFVIGGKDAENGAIKAFMKKLKWDLDPELSSRVFWQDGFTANPIWQAGSDFTIFASHFEPDGAKWESLYKGTPVICTRVGGHVDSVQDGVNGYLTGRTVPQIKHSLGIKDVSLEEMAKEDRARYIDAMGNDLADSIWRSAKTFYNRDEYAKMVKDCINGDQSWVIKDSCGKITGGALLGHMKDLGFNLRDFSNISEEAITRLAA